MNKSTISLCMIVKDEERCIERCLESISAIVDEIIFVDTGSTDRTLELIKRFNAKVFHYKWDNHFANARNYAIDQATGDYILHLDADEWLEDPMHDLRNVLDKDIYYLPIRNNLGGGLAELHKFPRLFRNLSELRYEGALHEQINLTRNWHRSSEIFDNIRIHHDGYLKTIVNSKNKKKRNLSILLEEIKENPSAFNYYNLGQQYYSDGEFQKALESYQKSYQYGGEFTFTKRLLLGLVQSLVMLKKYEDALSIARDSFSIYPDYVEFKYYEGLIFQELGYWHDAANCFEICIQTGDSNPAIHFNTYEGTGSYLAYAKLSEIAVECFDRNKANEYIVRAIDQAPNVMGLLKNFMDINYSADSSTLFEKISTFWPMQESVVQQLINVIYQLRHPVLGEFIKKFDVQTDKGVDAFVNILKGEYSGVLDYYLEFDSSSKEQLNEVLLISFLLSDSDMLQRYLNKASLRSEEQRVLQALVSRNDIYCKMYTEELENIVYDLVLSLLKLKEYNYMDYFTEQLKTPQMRYVLAKAFNKVGFYEIALSVLLEGSTKEERYKIDLLAAQSLRNMNSLEDSIFYYRQAYLNDEKPEILFQMYNLASLTNDSESMEEALEKISGLVPQSLWAIKSRQELHL
ncbi:hypothetical protein AWU65_07665 [Paenibacillus glucanolyticus]|uniref:Glycosyltransferase 2-like domain-containing protein n=1 Tax=Paenibacillus glucanolyticus TaxID=59843 RepID=A0A163I4X1_9BACL|nr:glycosyltransferase [Paenibacillus glucanolyticus]KZS45795.1 hypothetical protein AWU65_07665 [Paenibacillus glucanolyticus]